MKKNPANYCVLSDQTKDDRKIKKCKPASSHTKREIFTWQKERAAAGFKDMLFLSAKTPSVDNILNLKLTKLLLIKIV